MDGSSIFFKTDCGSIVSQIKEQEKQLRLKRRWLLGCDVSESENNTQEKNEFLKSEFLSESLLREDDIFYETVKSRVEEAFGFCKNEEVGNAVQSNKSKFCTKDVVKRLDVNLDSLTNKGLYLVAMILTGGSTLFEKTRTKMKKVIRESINRDLKKDDAVIGKTDIVEQLHQVLSDPGNFRKDCRIPTFRSHCDAAMKILSELEKLSTQTLLAMKRKLKGERTIPRLRTSKCGQSRSNLVNQVRKASKEMLSELSEGDKLQEPLTKAMSLVDLSFKLSPGYKTTATADFFQFSQETKNLQNEIVKAVWLLRKNVRFHELKRLHVCLDPETEVSNDSLRSAVRKMLIEYLFECSDMDIIPTSLLKALSLVKRSKRNIEHKVFPREAIEEETDCILNVSAHVKQMFWQRISNYELDQDFGDAYMEDLEVSDNGDDDENCSLFDNEEFVNRSSKCQIMKLEAKDTRDDANDSSDSDYEEGGAECSVVDPTDSTYVTSQHYFSSFVDNVVIRDLPESITRIHPRSLYVTPTSNKSTLLSDRHDIGTSKVRVKVERDTEMEVDNEFSSRSLFSVENIKTDDHVEQKPNRRKKNQYLAVQEISDETSLVAHNLIGRLLEKFADRKGLHLEEQERSYLGGESRSQEDIEVSEEKQPSLQEKSDESIIVSAVKELMPSLEKSVLMKLKELMEVS